MLTLCRFFLEPQLKLKLSQLASAQEDADALRAKVSALRDRCQQCEALAQQVRSDAERRDKEREAALARAKHTENEMAAKIASLEAALFKNNQYFENEACALKAEIERMNADKERDAVARRAAEGELTKLRADLAKAENHAAELHAALARTRQEAEGAINSYKER